MSKNSTTNAIVTIGLDIAKRFFQVHGVDKEGKQVVNRKLPREKLLEWLDKQPSCLVAMEACATAHYWAREISKLGHEVKLLPPIYVKPYVKRQKNDIVDAAAIAEASTRPSMRFVTPKTEEQQAVQTLHRSRELLIKQRTQIINALRAHLAEFGYIFKQGDGGLTEAKHAVQHSETTAGMPAVVRSALEVMVQQIEGLQSGIRNLERQIHEWHRNNEASQRVATIPGVSVLTATAIVAAIGDGKQFGNGRDLAAWLGMVPRQHSSGGKDSLGGITKKGNSYIRRLLVMGAIGQMRGQKYLKTNSGQWAESLMRRKHAYVAAVAMGAKSARVAWVLLAKGGVYDNNYSADVGTTVSVADADTQALAA